MHPEKRQAMPIGIDDFKEIIASGSFFADKSSFIVDILNNHAKVTLITRPRRFGKTLNLSMLRYFFDTQGGEDNRKLFDGLAVSENPKTMQEMGQHPVVMLSLKSIKASCLNDQLDAFRALMRDLYNEHLYLLDYLDAVDAEFFNSVRRRDIDASGLAFSLKELIKFIERYRGKKVVVLMDEYDHPLLNAFARGFEEDFRDFYRSFMGHAFKGNEALYFAVITGVVQIAGSGLFSDFNNADVYNLLDEHYATAFGFTEADVKTLLHDENKTEKFSEVTHWYNGYLFGRQGHVIYNPWSVLQYVARDCTPSAYWAHTSDNQLLRKELDTTTDAIRADFVALMAEDGKIATTLDDALRFAEVGIGREESLWVLLLSSGYLKARLGANSTGGLLQTELSVPNEEVRFIYHRLFRGWLIERFGSATHATTLLQQLTEGNVQAFCQDLETFFLTSVSTHDVTSDTVETFYHGFVLGLLGLINQTQIGHLRSNRESGTGRYDILVEPRAPNKTPGVIIELKRLDPKSITGKSEVQIKKLLEAGAKEGLQQIKDKDYATDLKARGVCQIAYIALAFSGKLMASRFESPS